MSNMQYTPLQLSMAAGLLNNQGLAINAELLAAIAAYSAHSVTAGYISALTGLVDNIDTGVISQSTVDQMIALGTDQTAGLINAVPPAYSAAGGLVPENDATGLTGRILAQADRVMQGGNLAKFAQVYSAAEAYAMQVNGVIDSLTNCRVLEKTFLGHDSLITGTISDLTDNIPVLAGDLHQLGQSWDFSNLSTFGYPSSLVSRMMQAGGILPELMEKFTAAGLTTQLIADAAKGDDIDLADELKLYQVMQTVTGRLFDQVKFLLDVTTEGLATMADLLNPVYALPNSCTTLTFRAVIDAVIDAVSGDVVSDTSTSLERIYLDDRSVNENLQQWFSKEQEFRDLARVVPYDQALAMRAIAIQLQQIKNIHSVLLLDLSTALQQLNTLSVVPQVQSVNPILPEEDRSGVRSKLATGTGPDTRVLLVDLLGASAGVPYAELLQQLNVAIAELEADGIVDPVVQVWAQMETALGGGYTQEIPPAAGSLDPPVIIYVIPDGPAAGTYSSIDQMFSSGLIPAASTELAAIVAANSPVVQKVIELTDAIISALLREEANFAMIELNLEELSEKNTTGLLSLAYSAHDLGQDPSDIGSYFYFTRIAVMTQRYGQTVVAAMLEGQNVQQLNRAGIDVDTQMPFDKTAVE